jgi:hypothetical protein
MQNIKIYGNILNNTGKHIIATSASEIAKSRTQ